MVSCGLLARTVKASQSIVRVKPESMESIELLYGALWVAPPCYQDGGHSGPPRSLSACGADRLRLPPRDNDVAVSRVPTRTSFPLVEPCFRSSHPRRITGPKQRPRKGPLEVTRGQERTDFQPATTQTEVGIRRRMCALVRCERQLWASFQGGKRSEQK